MNIRVPQFNNINDAQIFAAFVSGRVTDDHSGSVVSGVTLVWTMASDPTARSLGPFYAVTDANGWYTVRLESMFAVGNFTPDARGYTIVAGNGTVATAAVGQNGEANRISRNIRILGVPVGDPPPMDEPGPAPDPPDANDPPLPRRLHFGPYIEMSGTIEGGVAFGGGEWTASPYMTVQPFWFPLYSPSDLVRTGGNNYDISDEDGDGIGTHVRWRWGDEKWTRDDIIASGIPYQAASGILTLPTEDFLPTELDEDSGQARTGSDNDNAPFVSGSLWFGATVEASGTFGSSYGELLLWEVKYDTGDPPASSIIHSSGYISQSEQSPLNTINVQVESVVDSSSGDEVDYRINFAEDLSADTPVTTAFASGLYYSVNDVKENTSYQFSVETRDAALNMSQASSAATVITPNAPRGPTISIVPGEVGIVDPVGEPSLLVLRISTSRFINDTVGDSGYRFYRWRPLERGQPLPQVLDSGWITTNTWLNTDVVVGETYVWAVQTRNSDGAVTPYVTTTAAVPSPADLGDIRPVANQFRRSGDITSSSPLHRWAIRLDHIDVMQTTYSETASLVSAPFHTPEPVYQIRLDADEMIPTTYPDGEWITYSLVLGEEANQTRVNILPSHKNADALSAGSVIVINSLLSERARELAVATGWRFVDVDRPINTIRLQATLKRPSDQPHSTPVLRYYTLRVKGRTNLYSTVSERGVDPQAILL
jgi:hypothetical protein